MTLINFTGNNRTRRKIYAIAGALLTLAIPYFIMLFDRGHIESEQSFCPLKMLTGFPCPGCGITKSFISLYEGNILKSFYYHLFGPFIVLFCVLTVFILSIELFTGKAYFRNILYSKRIAYIMAIILVIYHLARLVVFVSTNNFDEILRQSIWK